MGQITAVLIKQYNTKHFYIFFPKPTMRTNEEIAVYIQGVPRNMTVGK